jgi:hypothetical protein
MPIQASCMLYPTIGPSTFSRLGMIAEKDNLAYMNKITSGRYSKRKAFKTLA